MWAARIRATGFTAREDFAANNVLKPPDAAEVTAMMERAAQQGCSGRANETT